SVPPVRGEEAIRPDGCPMETYKYWSPAAQQSMVDHVQGLLRLYGQGMHRRPDGRITIQTMFDPIPKPSFDAEGPTKYLTWLEHRYHSDIAAFNSRYGLDVDDFSGLTPDQYWLRPAELDWVGCARPTGDDLLKRTPDFHRWIDNQTHLAEVLVDYLATMRTRWRELDANLYVEPVLHQWGYFFNPPGETDWQTGQRALDIYRCAPHVDGVLYLASPLNAENDPDAAALSVEGSIMRTANQHRRFTAGLYLGRHVTTDVYRAVPPAEAFATHIANGAGDIHCYGYSGLDDGGVLFRMDDVFRASLRTATSWASQVLPKLDAPRAREAAILFPAEMSLYEPLELDPEGRHRTDLLGWYRQLTDLGWHVDIVHPDQVLDGILTDYQHLVIPTNTLHDLGDNTDLETAVADFTRRGGTVLHGPHCGLTQGAFGIIERPVEFDCIAWQEGIIPAGWSTVAYPTGQPLATYIQNGLPAITATEVGDGAVYSFGFQYGYSYARQKMPIVPPHDGKREMHPIVLLRRTPVDTIIGTSPLAPIMPIKGVEYARFGEKVIIVNHRATPVDITGIGATADTPVRRNPWPTRRPLRHLS
ncbi:MAG TPA: beta-galactosidase trimerization domain-containing protein, partial [Microlunatus sp.]|nr:beta-galactosidase trimerization domain-containing protein [Microlunatus sp.]